jgi:hypothetical protein
MIMTFAGSEFGHQHRDTTPASGNVMIVSSGPGAGGPGDDEAGHERRVI